MTLYYAPDDFRSQKEVFGRTSANHTFLQALLRFGSCSHLSLYVEEYDAFQRFQKKYVNSIESSRKTVAPIVRGDIPALHRAGLYMHLDPQLSKFSWSRSYISPTAFSLCGITHTLSPVGVAEELGRLLMAPLGDWDALICTSQAAKKVVENILLQWIDYWQYRYQQRLPISWQLPVLPLGINPDEVVASDLQKARDQFRNQYGIGANDFVVLFLGRLFFYEKAHPLPMYLAMEQLAQRAGKSAKIHFVQAGWFEKKEDQFAYRQAAKTFCPSVNSILISNINSDDFKKSLWAGADVFLSLADNIQETFGITPLEAMANRLPVVVSDWDGYKDTVREGVDGFLIPSVVPPSGCGIDLSLGYLTGAINYQTYSGLNAQMTAVDIGRCANRLWELYNFPELRKKMGLAAEQRVYEHFSWQKLMPRYEMLWTELSQRRFKAQAQFKKPLINPPIFADPGHTFSEYGTVVLSPQHSIRRGEASMELFMNLQLCPLGNFGGQQRLNVQVLQKIICLVEERNYLVDELVQLVVQNNPAISSGVVVRSLVYLMKYDLLRLG